MAYTVKLSWVLPVILLWVVACNVGVEASHRVYADYQSLEAVNFSQVQRTAYHFQPKQHWINGPMYYNGIYHLFYQYNPKGAVWGNIVWAHSVSTDMINWIPLDPAIYPSKPFDNFGCWSGSATILPGNKPVILYTGIVDEDNTQVQNYAVPADPSDPFLREWVKPDDNPLITATIGINKTAFRDPSTSWLGHDGHWRIVLGGRRRDRGVAWLYRSKDFKKWTKARHPLHTKAETGNWECPDFYPVSAQGDEGLDTSVAGKHVKHVLKVSLDATRYEYYTIGDYIAKKGHKERYQPDPRFIDGWKGLRYDYGNFYASKSFFDPSKNRRILWGWANESDPVQDDINKGWAGIQLIPRTIKMDPSGKQLLLWPIEEVEKLRGEKVSMSNAVLQQGDIFEVPVLTPAQADIEVTFTFKSLEHVEEFDSSWAGLDALDVCSQRDSTVKGGFGPFGLIALASKNLEEQTPVFFRVFKAGDGHKVLMCADGRRSSLKPGMYDPPFAGFVDVDLKHKKLSLRTLIDHSVVESFAARGKTCITSRVYPKLAIEDNAHIYLFNNGTEDITVEKLEGWSMNRPAKMN